MIKPHQRGATQPRSGGEFFCLSYHTTLPPARVDCFLLYCGIVTFKKRIELLTQEIRERKHP
jgi:hypothetical protein